MKAIWQDEKVIAHTLCLARSFKHFVGRDLLRGNFGREELARRIFEAPFALLSHGTEADPVLNYGNRMTLKLWEMSWEQFIQTPSRLTAGEGDRAGRAKLLESVSRSGFFEGYSGVRITRSGRRFEISDAAIWNVISESGEPRGQAAWFAEWKFL